MSENTEKRMIGLVGGHYDDYASSSDRDTVNLWDEVRESAIQRSKDLIVFVVKFDKLSLQMESANCSIPPGMIH